MEEIDIQSHLSQPKENIASITWILNQDIDDPIYERIFVQFWDEQEQMFVFLSKHENSDIPGPELNFKTLKEFRAFHTALIQATQETCNYGEYLNPNI